MRLIISTALLFSLVICSEQSQTFRRVVQQTPFRFARQSSSSQGGVTTFTHGCAHTAPNFTADDGSRYILTFLNDCKSFTAQQADEYCQGNGGKTISLDTTDKGNFVNQLMVKYAQRYIWTGGRINHARSTVTWPSGLSEGYTRGKRFWSHTGGSSRSVDIPQPDNRDGNEVCLAVLNNFYADGVKWHDVGCTHKKPTICEFK
uniref:Ctype lectin [Tribolium castaneum] n=1 Tax=Lepeophtheirus salmonis TaxID=72036 RepID=A0A0K2UC99_LEPSM